MDRPTISTGGDAGLRHSANRVPVNTQVADSLNRAARAEQIAEIARGTGERIERSAWDGVEALLLQIPAILAFVLAIIVGWLVGRFLARLIGRRFARQHRGDLGRVLGTIAVGVSVLSAGLLAVAILFPGINPKDVLSVLGIGSLAIGFAFKDILQNLVSGVILRWREPYRRGDEIVVGDGQFEGTVEQVETRATHIRTLDQRLIIIPNATMFGNALTVNTSREFRMAAVKVAIAYGSDVRRAASIVLEAASSAEGVRQDPPPEVAVDSLNDFSIDLIVQYAAGAREAEQIRTRASVLLAVHEACRANDSQLPYPTQVNILRPFEEGESGPDKLAETAGDS